MESDPTQTDTADAVDPLLLLCTQGGRRKSPVYCNRCTLGGIHKTKKPRNAGSAAQQSYSATTGDGNKRFFGSNELGKTVFLEEAEAREHIKCRERAAPVDAAAILAECDKRFAKLCEDRYREFYGEDV